MCSEGVSVWFACKLCKSFFLNADDFAYHKKKSHVQEFLNTKFIVFEEQTSPSATPPENWVSFLSPKEEKLIHKIISSPTPLPSTISDVINCNSNASNDNVQNNRNEEFIKIYPESNKDVSYFDDANPDSDEEKDQVSNSSFRSNFNSNSINKDTDKSLIAILKDPLQINTAIATSTDCDMTNQNREEHFSPINKSTLKMPASRSGVSRRKIKNPFSVSSNILQSVIQPPPNPYVHLKRLNMKTIQNVSTHSNSTVYYAQENDTSHNNSGAKSGIEPQVTDHFNPDFDLDPFSDTVNNSNEDIDVDVSETKFSNVTHNDLTNIAAFHDSLSTSESILPDEDDETSQSTSDATTINVFDKNQDSNEINPQSDFVSNSNIIPDPTPTTEVVNVNYGSVLEVVKTEFVADSEDNEFSDEDHDPLESESQIELSAEEDALNVTDFASNSLNETQSSQAPYFCLSCKTQFSSIKTFREHNKDYHTTQVRKRVNYILNVRVQIVVKHVIVTGILNVICGRFTLMQSPGSAPTSTAKSLLKHSAVGMAT